MSALEFIATMTGHLAWPIAAVLLGLIFKRQLGDLMKRLRRLTWRESAAELAEATEDVQSSIKEAAKSLLVYEQGDEDERERERRGRIERLMQDSAQWGFSLARNIEGKMPDLQVTWHDGQPEIHFPMSSTSSTDIYALGLAIHETVVGTPPSR